MFFGHTLGMSEKDFYEFLGSFFMSCSKNKTFNQMENNKHWLNHLINKTEYNNTWKQIKIASSKSLRHVSM